MATATNGSTISNNAMIASATRPRDTRSVAGLTTPITTLRASVRMLLASSAVLRFRKNPYGRLMYLARSRCAST